MNLQAKYMGYMCVYEFGGGEKKKIPRACGHLLHPLFLTLNNNLA